MEKQPIKPKTLQLQIVQELAKDKSGKEVWSFRCPTCQNSVSDSNENPKSVKCPRCNTEFKNVKGEKQYRRDDFIGLLNLLNRFNSTLHGIREYKMYLKLKDHLFLDWSKESKLIDLSLDEATFLKTYLTELNDKDGKSNPLQEFEMRTLVGMLEQLGD